MTRTQNSFFNLITNFGASLLVVALSFVTRSVFIHTLGTTFLGLEGLFTNILSMLSLSAAADEKVLHFQPDSDGYLVRKLKK